MVRALLILSIVAGGACVRGGGAYRCASDAECSLDGLPGVCESIGYCSFPDPDCEQGYRYGVHSGAYANDCVVAEVSTEVSIGGSVEGLVGSNLVLRNNGGDDLLVTTPGPFTFGETVITGVPYEVTIAAQPSNPSQTCSMASGMGIADTTDVTDVVVDCATTTYTIGGTVLGLVGSGMVLTNNNGDDKPITGSGNVPFTFSTSVASGTDFAVAIKTQPGGQTCSVSGGMGTVGAANVASIVINCNAGTFTIGGMVSGLQGTVVLKNNLTADTAMVTANGGFAFPMPLATTSMYSITVGTQPSYPPRSQNCIVTNGTGTVGSANVTSVTVACSTNSFSVGGSVTGLTGSLALKNGTDTLTVTTPMFTFGALVLSGNTYNVQITAQPAGQTCSLTSGATGTVGNGNVTNVAITCTAAGGDPGILCGAGLYCDPAAGQLCCINNGTPACATACNGGGTTPIRCDDQADCAAAGTPALVCCGSVNGDIVNNIYCSGASQCTAPKAYYCDPGVASPCPNGGTCTATMYPFPGYYRCF